MLQRLKDSAWDQLYLWIFALVEGTKADRYIRKALALLEPEENPERKIKEFYGKLLITYLKLFFLIVLLGIVVGQKDFWMFLLSAVLIGMAAPFWDVNQKLQTRRKGLQREYYALVSRLTLYVGAGMSTRNAFERMAEDISKVEEGYLRTEMSLCLKQLKTGHMETDCYHRFGQRCDLPEYMRLVGLLAQNAKKGNREMLVLLETEMEEAKEKQRHEIRRRGERASTKLLGPMMLLLAMVLLLIMIPAFGSL